MDGQLCGCIFEVQSRSKGKHTHALEKIASRHYFNQSESSFSFSPHNFVRKELSVSRLWFLHFEWYFRYFQRNKMVKTKTTLRRSETGGGGDANKSKKEVPKKQKKRKQETPLHATEILGGTAATTFYNVMPLAKHSDKPTETNFKGELLVYSTQSIHNAIKHTPHHRKSQAVHFALCVV